MAKPDVNWTKTFTKLMLQSGSFTSTVKSSVLVSSFETVAVQDMEWDGTDCLYCGNTGHLRLQSGQHTSTQKTSIDVTALDTVPTGISDLASGDTPWLGLSSDKLYTNSGRFTSTLKTSLSFLPIGTPIFGMTVDDVDCWLTLTIGAKMMKISGQFTTTVKTSLAIAAFTTTPHGISIRLGNTYLATRGSGSLFFLSGQFTSTVKDSLKAIGDNRGIATQDFENRLNLDATAESDNFILSANWRPFTMPFPIGRIFTATLNATAATTATALTLVDQNGNTITLTAGDRITITDVIVSNIATAKNVILFQDLDGDNGYDAGEELLTFEFSGQGTLGADLSLPLRLEKINAAATNDLMVLASTTGNINLTVIGWIGRT